MEYRGWKTTQLHGIVINVIIQFKEFNGMSAKGQPLAIWIWSWLVNRGPQK